MEGTDTLILLEEVLTGKIQDRKKFDEQTAKLHLLLSSSSKSILRAAGVIVSRLNNNKKIRDDNFSLFQKYLQALLSNTKPKALQLNHSGFSQDLAKKTSKLLFGLFKLQKESFKVLHSAFTLIKAAKFMRSLHIKLPLEKAIKSLLINHSEVAKATFGTWKLRMWQKKRRRKAGSSGNYYKLQLKTRIIREIVKNSKPSFESLAYWKWKIKVSEYKECAVKFSSALDICERIIKIELKIAYFEAWKANQLKYKKYFKSTLCKSLRIAEMKCFYMKELSMTMWKCWKGKEIPKVTTILKPPKQKLRSSKVNKKSHSLKSAIHSAELRYRCLLHQKFTKFHFNSLLEETISEIQHSRVIKRRRKRIVNSSLLTKRSDSNNSISFRSETPTVPPFKPFQNALKSTILRYFFIQKLVFHKWKQMQSEVSFSEEQHHHVIKRKRILSPKHLMSPVMDTELQNDLEMITSHTVHMKGIPKPTRSKLLRSSKVKGKPNKARLNQIVERLKQISLLRKSMVVNFLSNWKAAGLRFECKRSLMIGVIFSLIRNKNQNKCSKQIAFRRLKGDYRVKFNESEGFNMLAKKALEFSIASKLLIKIWKVKIERGSIYPDIQQIENKNVKESSVFISKEILKARLISINKTSLRIPERKNIGSIKPNELYDSLGLYRLIIALQRLIKHPLHIGFSQLRLSTQYQNTLEAHALNSMVSTLLFIFSRKALRCFRPIKEYKNADEIRRRALRKLKVNLKAIVEAMKLKWNIWKVVSQKRRLWKVYNDYRGLKIKSALIRGTNRQMLVNFGLIVKKQTNSRINLKVIFGNIIRRTKLMAFKILTTQKVNFPLKIAHLFYKISTRTLRTAINRILSTKSKQLIQKLIISTSTKLRFCLNQLKHRVNLHRLIEKLRSAYILNSLIISKTSQALKCRLNQWKIFKPIRKFHLLRKYLLRLVFHTSISYESALWRWKLSHPSQPLQSNYSKLTKKLSYISTNYQNRLKQFSIFKLVMFSSSISNPNKRPNNQSQYSYAQNLLRLAMDSQNSSFLTIPDRSMNDSLTQLSFSTSVSSRLSKIEITNISQIGSIEVLFNNLRSVYFRRLSWGITSIEIFTKSLGDYDEERERYIDEINSLRYDKHSLLEDNTTLRMHNEALVDNLERTNTDCYSLSVIINDMKIARMVSVVSKMIELPMLDSLLCLKYLS